LARVQAQLGEQDFQLFRRVVDTWLAVMAIVNASRLMLSRLRRLFGLSSSEKSSAVLRDANSAASASASAQAAMPEANAAQPTQAGRQEELDNSPPPPDEPRSKTAQRTRSVACLCL
jgi:hypothetical protein